MACRRRRETEASARVLGIGRLEWLGLPEGEWSEGQLEPALGLILQQFSPHVVYAPSRVDFHPEHWKVAYALSLLLLDAGILRNRPREPLLWRRC
jgi:LmbE family N-acetylglucosaminyl deacetylase